MQESATKVRAFEIPETNVKGGGQDVRPTQAMWELQLETGLAAHRAERDHHHGFDIHRVAVLGCRTKVPVS